MSLNKKRSSNICRIIKDPLTRATRALWLEGLKSFLSWGEAGKVENENMRRDEESLTWNDGMKVFYLTDEGDDQRRVASFSFTYNMTHMFVTHQTPFTFHPILASPVDSPGLPVSVLWLGEGEPRWGLLLPE